MKKLTVVAILVFSILVISSASSQAQLGAGVKIPPLVPPNVFVSYWISDSQLLEASASFQLAEFVSAISIAALVKYYIAPVDAGNVILTPFFGGGGAITFASVSALGTSTSSLGLAVFGLAGVELPIPNTPLFAFAELGLGVSILPVIGFAPFPGVGVRFEF
jgi:hypothetical protein